MNRVDQAALAAAGRQKGTTLIVVIVLLLLVAVASLFALNVGVFEQRSSGNDLRSKMTLQVAEGALSQGMEYFNLNRNVIATVGNTADPNFWQLCTAGDTSFPCGAAPAARRATMYRFIGGTIDINGAGGVDAMEGRMLPIPTSEKMSVVNGGFAVQYGTGALLCMVKQPLPGAPVAATECTTTLDPNLATTPKLLTLVAVGSVPGESGGATVTQTIGLLNLLNNPPGKPPVVAAGSVDVTGGIQVVTNPNGAGPGVPVSVWTRKNMDKTGTPNTCYLDEFIRYGAQNNSPPIFEGGQVPADNPPPAIITCDTCQCEGDQSLSYQSSGNASGEEGIDILDCETCQNAAHEGVNFDVLPEEFPCDLFALIFSVGAWSDGNADNFCETRRMVDWDGAADGQTYNIGEDEKYLYERAKWIIPTAGNLAKVAPSKVKTCAALTDTNTPISGLVWDQTGCGIGSNQQVATPDEPVLLVSDGAMVIQGRMFGLLFLRSTTTPLDPAVGGNATLRMNAGAIVYGSVVIQGQFIRGNGTSAIVYNAQVLTNLGNEPEFNPLASVPGSWSDRAPFSF
jgi:hypothetical protein